MNVIIILVSILSSALIILIISLLRRKGVTTVIFKINKNGKMTTTTKDINDLVLKILALGLMVFLCVYLFYPNSDAIEYVHNIFYIDIKTPSDASRTFIQGMSPARMALGALNLWLLSAAVCMGIASSFFKIKAARLSFILLGSAAFLMSFLNMDNLVKVIVGPDITVLNPSIVGIYGQLMTLGVLIFLSIYDLIITKEKYHSVLEFVYAFFGIIAVIVLTCPDWLPRTFLGDVGYHDSSMIPKDFNPLHFLFLSLNILIIVGSVLILRKKTREVKKFYLLVMALSCFMLYFNHQVSPGSWSSYPIQLCNTAVFLMLPAIAFDIKPLFYFNLLVNTIGAIFALMIPDSSGTALSPNVLNLQYSHIIVFVVPIISILSGHNKLPNLKSMGWAILIFTIYFGTVVFLNGYINNSTLDYYGKPEVDFFFTYSNHVLSKINADQLRFNYIVQWEAFGRIMTFYWLFNVAYFFVYIGLMFVFWFILDFCIRFALDYKENYLKRKTYHRQIKDFLQILPGRSIDNIFRPEGDQMIQIQNFSKRYANADRFAVKNFNLEVQGGEVFGFIGHNGAGKSTTIKSLVGIQNITEGDIFVEGYSIKHQALEAKRLISYISDNHAVYERLTGREYINYICDLYDVDQATRLSKLIELANKLNLVDALDKEIKTYSHGMKQKIVVISALIHDPKVWILDEPLTGLDPMSAKEIKQMMREHANSGNIVFFSSHDIDTVKEICDRIGIISQGELQGIYDMKKLLAEKTDIAKLYFQVK